MKIWNSEGQQNSIHDALKVALAEHTVISVVGAGGKTSLIFAWARELSSSGRKVVVTTTTHMLHPEFAGEIYEGRAIVYYTDYNADASVLSKDCAEIDKQLNENRILMLASEDSKNSRKVTAPPGAILDYAYRTADVILIEADGSRNMPLKIPKRHEPVVPGDSDVTICVAGLSALGRSVNESVYGPDEMSAIKIMGRQSVDEAFMAALLSSPSGGFKGAAGEFRVYLNQADTPELQEKAAQISELLSLQNIQCAWGTMK